MDRSSLPISINRVSGEHSARREDSVAVEEPLEIQLSTASAEGAAAKSISITMRTPGHDMELALGFLATEGIIDRGNQVVSVEAVGETDPDSGLKNTIRIELEASVNVDLERLQRHFYTTSSCGVCGKSSLEALRVAGAKSLRDTGTTYSRKLITGLPDKLLEKQRLFSKTGGLHAAAVFDAEGEIVTIREDVGRHNAVDKVVGHLLMNNSLPAENLGLIVSGRASFELMQKALVAGIPTLIAVSAPSSLAVQLAVDFDMTLVGFLRGENFNLYSGNSRIL